MKDICCIGHITLDKIITPRRTVYMSGGTSFYFSYALNSLPKTVDYQLVTALGKSEMNAVAEMRAAGIDVKAFTSSNTVYFENKYEDNFYNRSQRMLAKADPLKLDEVSELDAKI